MPYQPIKGKTLRLIETFFAVNREIAPPVLENAYDGPVVFLAVTKGHMQITFLNGEVVDFNIPEEEAIAADKYRVFCRSLGEMIVETFQLYSIAGDVQQALAADGLAVNYNGVSPKVNPLKSKVGELDQF